MSLEASCLQINYNFSWQHKTWNCLDKNYIFQTTRFNHFTISGLMNIILTNLNFILTYADDILAPFDNEQASLNFLIFLNNRYRNIKFTIKNKLTIPSPFLMQSFQVSINKISLFKHIRNRPIQDLSLILRVLHHFHIILV